MAIVDGPLFTAVRAKIDAEFGPIPPEAGPGATVYRDKLARLVMFAAQYVRDNGEVAVGITVDPGTFVAGIVPVTGEGVTSSVGTIT